MPSAIFGLVARGEKSAEFLWRKKHDLPCSQQENGAFTRPMMPSDLEYFYVSMELSFKTGGEAFFYIH